MEEILADMDKVTRRKERLRQYYLAHREKLLAASKLYNKNHPEKAKEYREHRRKHHPEREKEYRLRYYNKNKEKIASPSTSSICLLSPALQIQIGLKNITGDRKLNVQRMLVPFPKT